MGRHPLGVSCYSSITTEKRRSCDLIHRFSVFNYLSVGETVQLDMRIPRTAPHQPGFRESKARAGTRVPTLALLIGPNASGKTTLLTAFLRMLQIASADLGDRGPLNTVVPFMSRSLKREPTRFELDLEADWLAPEERPEMFRYTLAVDHGLGSAKRDVDLDALSDRTATVHREALYHFPLGRPRRLFSRDSCTEGIHVARDMGLRGRDERLDAVRADASVIATLDALNVPLAQRIAEQFRGYLHATNLDTRGTLGADELVSLLDRYPALMERVRRDVQCSDLGIRDLVVKQSAVSGKTFWFEHEGVDALIPLGLESAGTQRLLRMLPQVGLALDETGLAVFDEIDADLHVDLVAEMIDWFRSQDRNPHGAQLFMTAHNVGLLDDREKEEVFIVEKEHGATQVYGLKDIEGLRRGTRLYAKYRAGVLGGLPTIG